MENNNERKFNLKKLIEFRHWMHQNAELSLQEYNTQAKVKEYLLSIGVEESSIKVAAKTGLCVELKGKGVPKGNNFRIALRCDLDGLLMAEKNPHLEYASITKAAHMCGHDGHAACLLGGASLIMENLEKIPSNKTIRLLFQPAEEDIGGARIMIAEGCMEGVDEIYGMHNRPKINEDQKSKIQVSDHEMMAQYTGVNLIIKGKGGHGSSPERCNNPVPIAAEVYLEIMKNLNLVQKKNPKVRFSLPVFQGGGASNVIPDTCKIAGSLRCFSQQSSDEMEVAIRDAVTLICLKFSVEFDLEILHENKAVVNNPKCAQFVRKVTQEYYGEQFVSQDILPVYGSEDFSEYLQVVPGCFFFVVTQNFGNMVGIHSPSYDFDDSVIGDVSQIWYRIVEERCNSD